LVQVIILAPALGIAAQLGGSELRRHPVSAVVLARRAWMASAFGVAVAVVVIVFGFVLFPHQGGTVGAGHHSANGSPPVIGMVGILGSYIGCAALGVRTLVRRRTAKRAGSVTPVRGPATAAARR
jgi:xanthosine utilization system XapX-like protein